MYEPAEVQPMHHFREIRLSYVRVNRGTHRCNEGVEVLPRDPWRVVESANDCGVPGSADKSESV